MKDKDKNKGNKTPLNRRHFLKLIASSGLASAVPLSFMRSAEAGAPNFSGYKALVCVFLHGGNDSFNMLIPTGTEHEKGYTDYANIRGNLTVANNDLGLSTLTSNNTNLNDGILGVGSNNPYSVDSSEETAYTKGLYPLGNNIALGVNGVMPELAQLITDNKVSLIANIGTLVEPAERLQIHTKAVKVPLFLFAHDHQQRALQTGQADNLNDIGWAGKIADQWSGINNNSPLGLNISYAGNDRMLIGRNTTPLVMQPGTPPRYKGMEFNSGRNADEDRRAFFKALTGIENSANTGNVNFDASTTFTSDDPFITLYGRKLNNSFKTFDTLYGKWVANQITYTEKGSYGEDLFAIPTKEQLDFKQKMSGKLIKQLESVAKMIDLGANGAFNADYNRQIFYVSLGGFDTHSDQLSKHPLLLRELSLALWKFQKALEERGHENKVTTFTMSDFGRSMSNNGDGTDHGWGSYHLVMGGDGQNESGNLKGGNLIGEHPNITLNSNDDYSNKGRIIPKISQDQLNAKLCSWLGLEDADIARIFPNLTNFKESAGDETSAYLNALFVG